MYVAQNGELCRNLWKNAVEILVPSTSKNFFSINATLWNSSVNIKAGLLTALKMKVGLLSCFMCFLVI